MSLWRQGAVDAFDNTQLTHQSGGLKDVNRRTGYPSGKVKVVRVMPPLSTLNTGIMLDHSCPLCHKPLNALSRDNNNSVRLVLLIPKKTSTDFTTQASINPSVSFLRFNAS